MGAIVLDEQNQPLDHDLHASPGVTRGIHELIGFLQGIIADRVVTIEEIDALAQWCAVNRETAGLWPASVLVRRLETIYADGVVDPEERADLAELINEIVGQQDNDTLEFCPADLPLTKPAPDVVFDRNEFVFTGKFLYGSRTACKKAVELRGGRCSDTLRLQTSFLVIGSRISSDWRFSSFGTKIAKAHGYASRPDCSLAIISEQHWQRFLL